MTTHSFATTKKTINKRQVHGIFTQLYIDACVLYILTIVVQPSLPG